MRLPPLSLRPKAPGTVGFQPYRGRICLPPSLHPSTPTFVTGRECHFCVTPLPNAGNGTGILNRFAIGCAFRPRLRSRLTLIRLTLIRNPWVFGVPVSHRHYRYSCLQFRSRKLNRPSQSGFRAIGMLPYLFPPAVANGKNMVSVTGLCPQIIDAGSLDQ